MKEGDITGHKKMARHLTRESHFLLLDGLFLLNPGLRLINVHPRPVGRRKKFPEGVVEAAQPLFRDPPQVGRPDNALLLAPFAPKLAVSFAIL